MKRLNLLKNYACDCLSGKILSCRKHKNACKRFLNDLERYEMEDNYPYYWDEREAENIVIWFSNLHHSKGELTNTPINLTPWQQFHICQLYGWRRKKDKKRRFKKMFIEVSRKNAKSQELAGICLYECGITASKNNEVCEIYTAGIKRDQSKVVFGECDLMLRNSKIRPHFNITKNRIEHPKTGSFIRALSKDDKNGAEGTNIHLLVIDEYHLHETTEFVDQFIGANSQEPLLVTITTAGRDLNKPCHKEYEYCSDVIDPDVDVEDEEYLIDIMEQDEEEIRNPKLLLDEDLWIKSNPIRATYEAGKEKIRSIFHKALKVPDDMPACLTKNFDIWVQSTDTGYMNMEKWKKCEVEEYPIDIKGMSCVIGVDISSKIDLSSVCIVIPYLDMEDLDDEDEPIMKYIVEQHSFIPNRDALRAREISDKVPYTAWEMEGYLSVTDSQIVDQKFLMLWAINRAKELGLDIACWAVDPWNSSMFMSTLIDKGYEVYDVGQSYSSLNDPTVGFREDVYENRVFYKKDPLLNFCMSNAVVRRSDGRIKIDKDASKKRIDPVDALLCAYKLSKTIVQNATNKKQYDDYIDEWLNADW